MKQKYQNIKNIDEKKLSSFTIPQWQIDKVLETKKKKIADPSLLITWEDVKKNIRARNKKRIK